MLCKEYILAIFLCLKIETMSEKLYNIPTHLITGFLGVGKTTAIRSLMEHRSKDEKWLIVVNEFGETGIDGAMVSDDKEGYEIREIPGGCICCTGNVTLRQTLVQALRKIKPRRVLIEPTGLGHPAGIIDLLTNDFAEVLDLKAVITLVDPGRLKEERVRLNPVFIDQVMLADIVVANKTDRYDEDTLQAFYDWAAGLFPAKQIISHTQFGALDPEWLQEERNVVRQPQYPNAHRNAENTQNAPKPYVVPKVKGLRYDSFRRGTLSKGWIFHNEKIFNAYKLRILLDHIDADRVKGVFHTTAGWVSYNRSGQEVTAFYPVAYRKDSRVEVITTTGNIEEERIEAGLNASIQT